jgi:hypothetical protein
MGKGVTDHANRAEGLDAHSVDQRGVGEIGDQPAAEATGVVDDRIESAEVVDDVLHEHAHRRVVVDVGAEPAGARAQLAGRSSARLCVSAADRHLCALGDQQAGDLPADAAAGARDENDPVMQSEIHGHGRAS